MIKSRQIEENIRQYGFEGGVRRTLIVMAEQGNAIERLIKDCAEQMNQLSDILLQHQMITAAVANRVKGLGKEEDPEGADIPVMEGMGKQ